MLNQLDIDELQMEIQGGNTPELYYVCHYIEPREGVIDEEHYKSVSRFRVIKIKITEIINAYFEYLNYENNKDQYHIESEEEYYDRSTKYIHYYTVPNGESTYEKDFNPRIPSIIYGYQRQIIHEEITEDYNEPSPVKAVFTNALEYGKLRGKDITTAYRDGDLDWKYMTLDHTEHVDDDDYKYVTSDWYILKCGNFPRTEHILINTKSKTAYFRELDDAFNFIDQLEA